MSAKHSVPRTLPPGHSIKKAQDKLQEYEKQARNQDDHPVQVPLSVVLFAAPGVDPNEIIADMDNCVLVDDTQGYG